MISLRRRPEPVFRVVVRFSVLDHGNDIWRTSQLDDADSYRARLWDPERLAVRTEIFVRRALPLYQVMAQRHDVKVLVQHNPGLPVLPELVAAAARHDVLRLVPMDRAEPMHETVHADLAGSRSRGQAVLVRVDDDDLLAVDVLDQIRPFVTPGHEGWSVSLATGLVARHDGTRVRDFRRMRKPFRAIGQAFIGGAARAAAPLWPLGNHLRAFEDRPAIVHGHRIAWLQLLTEGQDSRVGEDEAPGGSRSSVLDSLRRMPKVVDEDLGRVLEAFPTLASDIERVRRLRAGATEQTERPCQAG